MDAGRMAMAFSTPELYAAYGKKLDAFLEGMAAELLESQTAMDIDAQGGPVVHDPVKGMPDCQLKYLLAIAQRQQKDKAELAAAADQRAQDAKAACGGEGTINVEGAGQAPEGGAADAGTEAGATGPVRGQTGSNRSDPYGTQGQRG